MEVTTILKEITVDCKDDGSKFTVTDRIKVIENLLANTDYQLLHKGDLCYIYGKKNVKSQPVILVSSHVDCVYGRLFCQELESQRMWKGTFDNSLTNACVLYDMIHGKLNDNVIVAFTGDEERNFGGAIEVIHTMRKWDTLIALAIVPDITKRGYDKQQFFTVENDQGIDISTGHRIIELLKQHNGMYGHIHRSEPDETFLYDEAHIPCFSLCIPSYGDMHEDDGVLVRTDALPTYCSVLSELANTISENLVC